MRRTRLKREDLATQWASGCLYSATVRWWKLSGGVWTSHTISRFKFSRHWVTDVHGPLYVSATPKVKLTFSVSAAVYSVHVPTVVWQICLLRNCRRILHKITLFSAFYRYVNDSPTQRRPVVVTSSNCDVIFGCQARRPRVSVSKPADRFTKYFATLLR